MADLESRKNFSQARTDRAARDSIRIHYLAIAVIFFLAGALSLGLETPMPAFVLLAVGLLGLSFALPTWQLPGLAIIIFAILPVAYLPVDLILPRGTITPAIGVLLIWELRVLRQKRFGRIARSTIFVSAITLAVMLLLTVLSSDRLSSAIWVFVFAVTLIVPIYVSGRAEPQTATNLRFTWMVIVFLLSIFAMLETLFQANPLSELYTVSQHWSVHRAMTTLGHPLMNGVFFAASSVFFGVGAIRDRRLRPGLVSVCAAVATALTASRSGVIGLILGLAVGLFLLICTSRIRFSTKVTGTILCFGGAIAVVANPVFQQRLSSDEAAGSAAYRDSYALGDAWRMFEDHQMFGVGPGQAVSKIVESSGFVLENAALASLVSLGLLGVFVVVVCLAHFCFVSLRAGQHEMPASLATYLVVGVAFPLWETIPSSLFVVTTILIIATIAGRDASGNQGVASKAPASR